MIEFQNCEVIINKSGILAESASLASTSPLSPLYALGRRSAICESPVGQFATTLNVSYIPETIWEPNLEIIADLKTAHNNFTYPFITGSVGGVTGDFYLQSYNLRSVPNEPNKATVSYVGFKHISGSLQDKQAATIFDPLNSTGTMHGWVTFPNMYSTNSAPIYEFQYDFRANWLPIYTLGNIYPTQVQLIGGAETLAFVRDVHSGILFSGESSVTHLDLSLTNSAVLLTGLSYINATASGKGYIIDCSGSAISIEIVAVLNDIIKVKSIIQKYF